VGWAVFFWLSLCSSEAFSPPIGASEQGEPKTTSARVPSNPILITNLSETKEILIIATHSKKKQTDKGFKKKQ
jgi:hypothetical protein